MRLTGLQTRRPGRCRPWRCAATAIVLTLMIAPATAGAAKGGNHVRTVARGLDNPRGLVFLSHGRLAVAEAGHAGTVCLGPGECVGLSGRVSAIRTGNGHRTTLAADLPSLGGPFGAFGLGGLATRLGGLYAVVGLSPQPFGDPAAACQGQADVASCVTAVTAVENGSGLLSQVGGPGTTGGLRTVAGVGRFDFDYAVAHPDPGNPEYAPGDANPFGLTAAPSGGFYVVDAASNTLDLVARNGDVRVLAFIPDPPNHRPIYDAAPTCAARTSNGDLFIGTESSRIWRWDGKRLTQVLAGGKVGQVVGCVADSRGNLYLANLASRIRGSFPDFQEKPFDGSIVKLRPDGSTSYIARRLNLPTGLTLGPDGKLYVALNGLCPSDLSLINSNNAPAGACPRSGRVVRLSRR